jgi:aspartokinase-like uncharacterized kinase
MEAVIKVGGSLAETPSALKTLGMELSLFAKTHSIVVVPGGGRFADVVRDMYSQFNLSNALSHRMAILAMDQFGLVLSYLIPDCCFCNSLESAKYFSKKGKVVVFLPSKLLFQKNPFQPSWTVTSDSIAAYIGNRLAASKTIFVTDVDGIFTENPKKYKNAALLGKVSICELLARGVRTSVDEFLPKFLAEFPLECWVVNGFYPERIQAILSGEETIGTRIVSKETI